MISCSYCGIRRAVHLDHVVPRTLLKRREGLSEALRAVVPSCLECNLRKGTRRLVPPSWASNVPALNDFFGGTPWRVWHGSTTEDSFKGVHK